MLKQNRSWIELRINQIECAILLIFHLSRVIEITAFSAAVAAAAAAWSSLLFRRQADIDPAALFHPSF